MKIKDLEELRTLMDKHGYPCASAVQEGKFDNRGMIPYIVSTRKDLNLFVTARKNFDLFTVRLIPIDPSEYKVTLDDVLKGIAFFIETTEDFDAFLQLVPLYSKLSFNSES